MVDNTLPGKIQLGSGAAVEAYLTEMVPASSGFYDLSLVGQALVAHLAGRFEAPPQRIANLHHELYRHFAPSDHPYVDRALKLLVEQYDSDFLALRRTLPVAWDLNGNFRYRFFRWAGDVMIIALY